MRLYYYCCLRSYYCCFFIYFCFSSSFLWSSFLRCCCTDELMFINWVSSVKTLQSFPFFLTISLYSASRYYFIEYLVFSSIEISITPLYSNSYCGFWKSFRYGCLSAYSTVILCFGLKSSIFFNRSIACSSMLGKNEANDLFFMKEIWFRHYWAITDSID